MGAGRAAGLVAGGVVTAGAGDDWITGAGVGRPVTPVGEGTDRPALVEDLAGDFVVPALLGAAPEGAEGERPGWLDGGGGAAASAGGAVPASEGWSPPAADRRITTTVSGSEVDGSTAGGSTATGAGSLPSLDAGLAGFWDNPIRATIPKVADRLIPPARTRAIGVGFGDLAARDLGERGYSAAPGADSVVMFGTMLRIFGVRVRLMGFGLRLCGLCLGLVVGLGGRCGWRLDLLGRCGTDGGGGGTRM